MMNIFDMFRGTSSSTGSAASQTPTPSNSNPAPSQNSPSPNGPLPGGESSVLETGGTASNVPPGGGSASQSQDSKKKEPETSPFTAFEKLWENVGTGKGNMPSLNADPAKISEAAKRIDFSKGVDPAVLQKAVSGDVNALAEALNTVAQNAFTIATQASTHLVDKHTSAVAEHMRSELPNQFKNFQATDGLLSENPRLANPAVQPLISVIQAQLAQQFPQATATELRAHAQKYLSAVVDAIGVPEQRGKRSSTGNKQQETQAKNQFDWETWAKAEVSPSDWQS